MWNSLFENTTGAKSLGRYYAHIFHTGAIKISSTPTPAGIKTYMGYKSSSGMTIIAAS